MYSNNTCKAILHNDDTCKNQTYKEKKKQIKILLSNLIWYNNKYIDTC